VLVWVLLRQIHLCFDYCSSTARIDVTVIMQLFRAHAVHMWNLFCENRAAVHCFKSVPAVYSLLWYAENSSSRSCAIVVEMPELCSKVIVYKIALKLSACHSLSQT
jgi:hypothetical protein